MLPFLSHAASEGPPALQDERYRAHRAVRELLERLAARGPLVLILDDVHWADAASVELLAALLRSPPGASVLIVLAARPRQGPDRLATALERADRQGGLTRIALGGLPREAAGELLGDQIARERADALYEEAGGNPFYLQQLARSDGAPRDGRSPALEAVGVPAAVIASLGEELALLSDDTRRVLRGAAVAGDPFESDLAAAAAGRRRGGRDGGLRRAARARPGARDRRAAALSLPASARPPGGLRERARRLAARCARALRDGAGGARRACGHARAPRRVRRAPRRPGGGRGAHGGRDGDTAPRPRQRRPLVQRRRAPAAGRHARASSASSSCWPGPARSRRRAASPRAMPTCSSASRSPRPRRRRCACS